MTKEDKPTKTKSSELSTEDLDKVAGGSNRDMPLYILDGDWHPHEADHEKPVLDGIPISDSMPPIDEIEDQYKERMEGLLSEAAAGESLAAQPDQPPTEIAHSEKIEGVHKAVSSQLQDLGKRIG